MTVTTTTIRDTFDGNGSTTDFDTSFEFFDSDEIVVTIRTVATGVDVVQVETTDYTVTGGNGSTGRVTFVAASIPASGEEVHIDRVTDQTQQVDLTPSQEFPAASVENALDRLVMLTQEYNGKEERYIRQPSTDRDTDDGYPSLELPDKVTRASGYLTFAADGSVSIATTAISGATTVSGDGALLVADTFAQMRGPSRLEAPHNAGNVDEIRVAIDVNRPAAAAFGIGLFFSNDEGRLWYSNGTTWTEQNIAQFATASLPAAAAATAGRIYLDTDQNVLLRDAHPVANLVPIEAPWARGSIGGLQLTRTSASILTVGTGEARIGDASDPSLINARLNSALTKDISAGNPWVEGDGLGGRVSGVAANLGWYGVFLIAKADGTTEIAFDDDADFTNGQAAAELTDWTYFRRIGWVHDSASMLDFLQDGDDFRWVVPIVSFTNTADYTAGVDIALTYSPPSLRTQLMVNENGTLSGAPGLVVFTETATTSASPSQTAAPLAHLSFFSATSIDVGAEISIRTDADREIRCRSLNDASTQITVVTLGWHDDRGRFD